MQANILECQVKSNLSCGSRQCVVFLQQMTAQKNLFKRRYLLFPKAAINTQCANFPQLLCSLSLFAFLFSRFRFYSGAENFTRISKGPAEYFFYDHILKCAICSSCGFEKENHKYVYIYSSAMCD